MIELSKAYYIALRSAEEKYKNVELLGCLDLGDRFAFNFGIGNEPIIGAPAFAVHKTTGKLDYLFVPPIDNLKLLNSGIEIDISAFI